MKAEYPSIFQNYTTETEFLKDIVKYKRLIAEEDAKRSTSSLENSLRIEQDKLNHYRLVRAKGTSTSLVDIDGNGWATDNVEDAINAQLSVVNRLKAEISKPVVNSYLENIKEMKDEDIKSVLDEITLSMNALGKSGKESIAIVSSLGGEFSKEQLGLIRSALETEQKSRTNKTTYKQDYEKAQKEWEDAKKELSEIEKDKSKFTSKQYEEAKKREETTEKAYKNLGGITGSSLTKQENQAKKEAENRLKQQEQLAEQLLSIRRKNQQDEINLMEDGTERKLKQIDLDYQRELDAIKKQRREWESLQGGKLTDEQMSTLGMWASNAAKGRESGISDVNRKKLESDRKAWQEYFIEYGNYQEKRKNLVQKYNDEIAKLQTDSPEYASKVAQKNKALEQLDEQFGHSTKAMADLFEDASNKSVSAIQSIIDKYEILIEYMSGTDKDISIADLKGIGFTDKDIERIEKGEISIKDVTDTIKGLKDELKGKSPWQAFVSDLEKGIEAIKKGGNDSKKIGQGITDIGNAVTSFAPALNEFGSSIADIFGFDDSKITSAIDALGGLGQTASGVGQIMSGDIVGGAMSAVSGISAVVSALDGMFGADYSHYNEMVEEYNKLNVGKEALELVNKSIEAYRILGRERLNSGASAGSHSIGKRMAKNTSSSDWQDIARALDMSVKDAKDFIGTGRMTGLFDLTTEQLEKLKSEAPTFWAKLDGDVRDYLDKIIEGEERIEEIHNQINEQLTQTTFDGVYSNFIALVSGEKFSDNVLIIKHQ